ncbi:hypothetical protein IEQ34_016664 [Dendrobium chrysotoxum]|uniref:Gnk2-homologous domain-containing protein n=1 Tax=Dendrobium chrysotoxum TaxID=161865 RepID=A0AAV7FYA4_DENCH|nr:hypothetical protein IEQ34_016664 [Dendrobium chrysotoxum]
MEFSYKLFISVLLLLLPVASFSTHNSSVYQLVCNKNFTNDNKILQINIKNTISSLVAQTFNNNTYAISSYGIGYDTIYGLIQCRGDSSNESCSSCVNNAVHQIRTFCPYSAESRIWYPFCFLRYDNYNFFGQADSSYTRVWPSALTAQNTETFNSALGWVLDAAMGSAVGKDVKIGMTIDYEENSNRTLYGIAQCTRDLDDSGCSYCLEKALEVMSNDCKNHLGCHLISNCCMFRYEIYNLFLEAESPNTGAAVSALLSNGYLN